MLLMSNAAAFIAIPSYLSQVDLNRISSTTEYVHSHQSQSLNKSYQLGATILTPPCGEEEDAKQEACSYKWSRRKAIVAAMAGLSAETAWNTAVAMSTTTTTTPSELKLPPGILKQIQSGRAVVIPNWLSTAEVQMLRADANLCFRDGRFSNFILSRNPNKADRAANDRWIMPSFAPNGGDNGPFADDSLGDFESRQLFKAKMASVKAFLASELDDRYTLSDDDHQTHEIEYLRYGPGAFLQRHTDEHHVELKRPYGSRLPKKNNASRRSVTWMVYLNDDWEVENDGGQLRLHERKEPAATPVGSRGADLQVGWLRATPTEKEQPVFLDPLQKGGSDEKESCILYTSTSSGADGIRRNLTSKPFANIALYLGGGDVMARKLMVDSPDDQARLHLIDPPKSLVSNMAPSKPFGGDGGEQFRDIAPQAGTLVMFDSVSLPHEVLVTNKERFGLQGWFHEHLGYDA